VRHLGHLKRLRTAAVVAVAAVVVAIAATIPVTGGSSHGSGGTGTSGHPVVAAFPVSLSEIPVTASSGRPPVTGDTYVIYGDGKDASAQISGQITNAASGEVARLYAQQFPYTSPPVPAGSVTLNPAGSTAGYSFQVTPTLATRYQVELFRDGTAATPLAISATKTIYVAITYTGQWNPPGSECSRPVCQATYTATALVPASALNTEMSKQWYPYFAITLSASGEPAPPQTLMLDGGNPAVSSPQRISADEFQESFSYSWQINNDGFAATISACTKDTEAEDGIGLPGYHGCGAPQIPRQGHGYLG